MKFSLALLVGTASASLVQRDLAAIQSVVTSLGSKVDALDTAVKSFSGDPGPLTSASSDLLSSIQAGTSTVSSTSALTQDDALQLASVVQGLGDKVNGVVSDLGAKKAALISAGACATVEKNLQDQKTATGALADAITSKVPTALQSIAAQLSGQITAALDTGISNFSNCPAGGAGPSSSSKCSSGFDQSDS
jgi:hypothetical protein